MTGVPIRPQYHHLVVAILLACVGCAGPSPRLLPLAAVRLERQADGTTERWYDVNGNGRPGLSGGALFRRGRDPHRVRRERGRADRGRRRFGQGTPRRNPPPGHYPGQRAHRPGRGVLGSGPAAVLPKADAGHRPLPGHDRPILNRVLRAALPFRASSPSTSTARNSPTVTGLTPRTATRPGTRTRTTTSAPRSIPSPIFGSGRGMSMTCGVSRRSSPNTARDRNA